MNLNKKKGYKAALTSSPFLKYFEFGINNEGYWTYSHLVLQLEDCIDCVQVLYPNYDFVFLFDHSSGHAKKRKDGLDALTMKKLFGGQQSHMHTSIIAKHDGYIGPFRP